MAVSNKRFASVYKSSPAMAARFVEMNGYKAIRVCKSSMRGGWSAWCLSDTEAGIGHHDDFARKSDAISAAREMSEVFRLPLTID